MRSVPGTGLAVGSIGVAIATYVATSLGIELPQPMLIGLGSVAVMMILAAAYLEFTARRGNDSEAAGPSAHAAHTGSGSVSGNVISHSTVNVTATPRPDDPKTEQFRRALANVEVELERAFGQIDDAIESGLYRRRFPIQGSRPHQALSELLADRNLSGELRQVSQTYRQLERLNSRMRERRWSGSAMPEITTPDVRNEDRLEEVKEAIESVLDTLRRLRAKDAPSRPQSWEEVSRRYASWEELAESEKAWADIANARVPLHDDVAAEIVAMIDEIQADVFTETRYATYIDWIDRNSAFIEVVLGPVERLRFQREARAPTIHAIVNQHIERLHDLLDRLPGLPLRVEAGRLRQAIQQRRESSRPAFVTMRR
jgi:hypothetical protein